MPSVSHDTNSGGLRSLLASAPGPLVFVAVGLSYLAVTQVVMFLQGSGGDVAAVWPAAGLGLAALMLLPGDRWVWALAALTFAEVAGDLAWASTVPLTVGWTVSRTLEPLLGALLLRRLGHRSGALSSARQLVLFLACGVVVAPAVGSTLSAGVSAMNGLGGFPELWSAHFVADALGVLVLAPVLLVVPARYRGAVGRWLLWCSPRSAPERPRRPQPLQPGARGGPPDQPRDGRGTGLRVCELGVDLREASRTSPAALVPPTAMLGG